MVAGTELHIRDQGPSDGSAPALLLLHGFGASLHSFEDWARDLSNNGDYRVISIDLPGSGLSPPDTTGNYSEERTIELIRALLDARGIEKITPIGNSIGGRIAWRFAVAHPNRTDRLVLISPDGYASEGFAYGKAPDVPLMLKAMRYALPKSMLKPNIAAAYADRSALSDQTLTRYHDLMLAPGSREALLDRMAQTILVQPEPLLAQIKAPVLLLWGSDDAMIPIANAQDYLAVLPNAELVELKGLGHVPHEEDPKQSLSALRVFLENSNEP